MIAPSLHDQPVRTSRRTAAGALVLVGISLLVAGCGTHRTVTGRKLTAAEDQRLGNASGDLLLFASGAAEAGVSPHNSESSDLRIILSALKNGPCDTSTTGDTHTTVAAGLRPILLMHDDPGLSSAVKRIQHGLDEAPHCR